MEYIPYKLSQLAIEIRNTHRSISDTNFKVYFKDNRLKRLIHSIAECPEDKLNSIIYALSNSDVNDIINYIPRNTYNVELKNLFKLFEQRADINLAKTLYNSWQSYYNNAECNEYILNRSKGILRNLIINSYMTEGLLRKAIESGIELIIIPRICNDNRAGYGIDDKAKAYGIYNSSRLFQRLEHHFYLLCSRDEYIRSGERKLVEVIRQYNKDELRIFVINLINEVDTETLRKDFRILAIKLVEKTGKVNSRKLHSFFNIGYTRYLDYTLEITEKDKKLYKDWIIITSIYEAFGYSQRGKFWAKYIIQDIHSYYNGLTSIEFNNHYVIESLETVGSVYIIEKEKFESIKDIMCTSAQEAKSKLYKLRNNKNIERFTHRGNWEDRIDHYLKDRHICYEITARYGSYEGGKYVTAEDRRRKEERRKITYQVRLLVLKRDNYTCKVCGKTEADGVQFHIDHIKPISKGGNSSLDNLQTLCASCNLHKSAKWTDTSID